MSVPLIQFNNVVKGFGDVVVLNGISFSISSGQVTTIIGKSGAGKISDTQTYDRPYETRFWRNNI